MIYLPDWTRGLWKEVAISVLGSASWCVWLGPSYTITPSWYLMKQRPMLILSKYQLLLHHWNIVLWNKWNSWGLWGWIFMLQISYWLVFCDHDLCVKVLMYWHSTSAVYRLKNSVGRDSVHYWGQICLCNQWLELIQIYSHEACFKVHTVEHLCNIFQIHSGLE